MSRSTWILLLMAFVALAAACGRMEGPVGAGAAAVSATKVSLPRSSLSVTTVPSIVNPAEELAEFAPDGILRWTAVAGADVYEVWAFADPGLTTLAEFSKSLVSRQYQFTQLAAGRTYYVKLYFRVGGLWGEAPAVTLQTTTWLPKPRLINAQEELDGLHTAGTLRWTPVAGAVSYELWIYRDAGLTAFAENSGPVRITQYRLRTLEAGKTYYARVFSRIGGEFHAGGALPVTVTATSDRARIVNPQEELDAFASDGLLRWTAVTGASSYEVWIFTNPNSSVIQENSGPLAVRSYATRTLQPGATYYAQVYAYVGGQWQAGAPVKLVTTSKPTVARLTNAQEELEAFGTSGTLRWGAVAGADRYEVWIYGNAGLGVVAESGGGSERSYAVRRLCDEATYYVQVHARVNGAWTAGWATPLRVTEGTSPADCVPPAPVVQISASETSVLSGTSIRLTWNASFADSCSASGEWSGRRAVSGEETMGPLEETSLYTLVCGGPSGASLGEVLVTVRWPRYRAVDLGNLGGDYSPFVFGLNNIGQAVGESPRGGGLPSHPFLWADGVMTDLGTLGGSYGAAFAINDAGQVAGYAERGGNTSYRAFLYTSGTMRDLGTLGGSFSLAYDVNLSGQVVGWAETAGGNAHPFLYSAGRMIDLGTLGGRYGWARGVNDAGHVVGFALGPEDRSALPFLYIDGVLRALGTLGGSDGDATDINNVGQVVGSADTTNNDARHAFLYSEGVMVDLGTLGGDGSGANAINEAGEVVGWAAPPDGDYENPHAFFYRRGLMHDLNECLVEPLPAPLRLTEALDINDRSEIVAKGCDWDETEPCKAYLLVPVEGD